VELADKPGSVKDNHSSRPAITHWLKQHTRSQRDSCYSINDKFVANIVANLK